MAPVRSERLSKHIKLSDKFRVDEDDIEGQLFRKEGSTLLLGRFTIDEVLDVLEREKILEDIREKNFSKVTVELDFSDHYHQHLILKGDEHLLGEIIMNTRSYRIKDNSILLDLGLSSFKALVVEWLVFENPYASFDEHNKRLPGQKHPGLGVGKKVIKILHNMGKLLNMDCILAFPEFYHNSVMYRKYFKFLCPIREGKFVAMLRDLGEFDLSEVSFAFSGGCVIEEHRGVRKTIHWEAEEMVYPLKDSLKNVIEGEKYRRIVETEQDEYYYSVDWKSYEEKKEMLKKEF